MHEEGGLGKNPANYNMRKQTTLGLTLGKQTNGTNKTTNYVKSSYITLYNFTYAVSLMTTAPWACLGDGVTCA